MKKLGVLLLVFLSACNAGSEMEENAKKNGVAKKYSVLPYVLTEEQVSVVADTATYLVSEDGKLVYRNEKSEIVITENLNSDKYWLSSSGSYVYAVWWEKFAENNQENKTNKNISLKGKTLYLRASQDNGLTFGDRIVLTEGGGVLPDVQILSDKKGNVNIVYLDERHTGYQIFTNGSQDGGKTWKKSDQRLNDADVLMGKKKIFSAVSPNIAHAGNELLAVWQQLDREKNKQILRIYSRSSFDFGKTWEKESLIYEASDQLSASIKIHSSSKEAYLVVGFAEKGLSLFSKKENLSWDRVKGLAPNSDKFKVGSYFKFASSKDMLYLTYVFVDHQLGGGKYWHTELVRLNRKNNTWMPKSIRFDFLGLNKKSRGGYQDVAVLDDGTVVVVWEDYRTILPMINFNYSINQGDTWLKKPLLLSPPKMISSSFFPFIKKRKNKMIVYYHNNEYPEGKKPKVKTVVYTVANIASPLFKKSDYSMIKTPNDELLRNKLQQRSEQLAQARVNKNWNLVWEMLDPVYRNMYGKKSWLRTRDRLVFKKMIIESIELNMPYGYAKGKITYDIAADFTGAEKGDPRFSNQEKDFLIRWGWFNNKWYQIVENPRELYLP